MSNFSCFSNNDGGRVAAGIDDKNDCAVRAWSIFFDQPYAVAHKLFAEKGRKQYRGTRTMDIFTMMKDAGAVKQLASNFDKITLNKLIKKHPKGKLYCLIRGHAFAIVDGIVNDTWAVGLKSRVFAYWTLPGTEKVEEEPIKINIGNRTHTFQIKEAIKRCFSLNPGVSAYSVAKMVSKELNISIHSANYHALRYAKKVLA